MHDLTAEKRLPWKLPEACVISVILSVELCGVLVVVVEVSPKEQPGQAI
jgi:hypothetical protein